MPWGLALHNSKVPAVPVVLYGCVVAQENPHVLLLQVATFLPFPSLSLLSCRLPDFYGKILGKVLIRGRSMLIKINVNRRS
jgi:hypothetical protein